MVSKLDILIERFHNKTISGEEHAELLDLLAQKEHAHLAVEFFKEVMDRQAEDEEFFSPDKSKELLAAVQATIRSTRGVRYLPIVKWATVAAAACLCIMFGYRVFQPVHKEAKSFAQKEIMPPDLPPGNKNKAVLILADNSRIELDSAASGVLGVQGNARIRKNDSGQVIYEDSEGAQKPAEQIYNILEIPNGGEYHLVLSDGSGVWLNSGSRLKFPVRFSGHSREVELSGEGYFEIAKNQEQPFRVHFNSSVVEVLGTHFNVNAYNNEATQAVTLLEGLVKVSRASSEVLIKPGQQAVLGQTNRIDVRSVASEDAIAWKNGYFMFVDEDIKSIMRKLSRWYDFTVEYQGNVENERFAAMISRTKNISEVLQMFESTGSIQFKIMPGDASGKGKKVIILK